MPLSEEEQRILYEIERNFYERDPEFAAKVKSETVYAHAGRNLKWGALAFLLGLVIVIASFTTSVYVAFAGFLVMLASAVFIERNARRLGKASIAQIAENAKARGVPNAMGEIRKKFHERFRKED